MPDGRYELYSATHGQGVSVYCAKFIGSHSLPGGPVPPSDPPKQMVSDYVYIIWFDNDNKVTRMRKIWDKLTGFTYLGWPLS